MKHYNIYFRNKAVGVACVEHVGLYTQFQCQCYFDQKGSYRIKAQYGTVCVDLGLCVPDSNAFVIKTKVANRKLNGETPFFFVLDTKGGNTKFLPVNPQVSFDHIRRLTEAKFYIKNGIPGILIKSDGHELPGMTSSE